MSGLDFGVDWYPEQWDESRWKRDAERMASYGFNVARIMEFAWTIIEPEPGRFDFSLFDRAIAALASAGVSAILGTPTATPPWWMIGKPVFRVSALGGAHGFGTRRNLCYNAPEYVDAALRVTEALAGRYGADPRVVGFQVDNEIGHEGSDRCVCPRCEAAWHRWLAGKYGDVGALNEAWGSVFWNTTVSAFDQVPTASARPSTGLNPSLILDYERFCSDSAVAFAKAQTAILRARARPGAFITTNLFPPPLSNAIDMERMTEGMDFASWDNYPVWGEQDEPFPWQFSAAAQAHVRGLRGGAPFAVMEEMSGFQGHACLGHLPPERHVALWAVQAVARGADKVLFFRWRTAPAGQEQLCYGLLDTDDEETERLRVISETARRAKAELGGLASTTVESPVCVVYSKDDARLLRHQYLSAGLRLQATPEIQAGYEKEFAAWCAPFMTLGVGVDVASASSLRPEDYRIISLPLHQLADPGLADRLGAWVEDGGTLVLGFRAGARTLENKNVASPLPGVFRRLAGVTVRRFESLNLGSARLRVGIVPGRGTVWADLVEPEGAVPVAVWTDKKKFYRGVPAVTVNRVGKGSVWYVGTSPSPIAMLALYRRIIREAGLRPRFAGADIEAVERTDAEGRRWRLVLNHSARPRRAYGVALEPWGWAKVPVWG